MEAPLQIGRYVLHDQIAAGGMATVHIGRLTGGLGFARTVAVKRILPQFRGEQEFVDMFIDETRLAARIQNPNVVSTLDVVVTDEEVFLVMEHVLGEPLARLLREARKTKDHVPIGITLAIVCGLLRGLHAAHEVRGEGGEPLCVVHRDVSPQNILVGIDGVARVIDFGVAKAEGRLQTTRNAQLKGKVAYMAPELLRGIEPDRRSDVYAAAVILWEALAGRRLFTGDNDTLIFSQVLDAKIDPPSRFRGTLPRGLDEIVLRGLARDPDHRWATAQDMLDAIEAIGTPGTPSAVGAWVRQFGGDLIDARAARIGEIERGEQSGPHTRRLFVDPSPSATGSRSVRLVSQLPLEAPDPSEASGTSAGYGRSVDVEVQRTPWWSRPTTFAVGFIALGMMVGAAMVGHKFGSGDARRDGPIGAAHETVTPPPIDRNPDAPTTAPGIAPPATVPQADGELAAAPATDRGRGETAKTAAASDGGISTASTPPKSTWQPPRPTPPKAPSATKNSCDPPWTVDAKGIRRFKPECL